MYNGTSKTDVEETSTTNNFKVVKQEGDKGITVKSLIHVDIAQSKKDSLPISNSQLAPLTSTETEKSS